VLAACLLALLHPDAESDEQSIDEQAAAVVLAESLIMWRKSVTKG